MGAVVHNWYFKSMCVFSQVEEEVYVVIYSSLEESSSTTNSSYIDTDNTQWYMYHIWRFLLHVFIEYVDLCCMHCVILSCEPSCYQCTQVVIFMYHLGMFHWKGNLILSEVHAALCFPWT